MEEVANRQASTENATLSVILTDLHTHYHPPTTDKPLEVDENKEENADNDTITFAPKSKLCSLKEKYGNQDQTHP